MTFFSNVVHQFSTVHGIDLVFSAYYADTSCRQSHVGVFWYHFLFINFQGHEVKILSDVRSFFEIFFVLDLGRKNHINMCASSIWRFGHNENNTINIVQVMGSSSSSLTEVQARRRRSILVMMRTQITSSESRSLVLQ